MSTDFNGTSSEQRHAIGAVDLTGAFTIVDGLKSEGPDDVWQSHTTFFNSGGSYVLGTGRRDSGDQYLSNAGGIFLPGTPSEQLATAITQAAGWVIRVTTKAAGDAQPYFYRFSFTDDEWVQTLGSPLMADHASQAGGHIRFGRFDTDFFAGKRFLGAAFERELSFAEIQTITNNRSTIDVHDLGPAALWDAGDQFASDLTGNGADLTLDTDTEPSEDRPPDGVGGVWSYGLTAPAEPPASRSAPVVSYTTPTPHVGLDLSCSQGGWLKFPETFAYQWLRNEEEIVGATSSTHTMQPEDERQYIACRVTASNGYGSTSATSNEIRPRAELLPAAPATIMIAIDGEWVPRPIRYVANGEWT